MKRLSRPAAFYVSPDHTVPGGVSGPVPRTLRLPEPEPSPPELRAAPPLVLVPPEAEATWDEPLPEPPGLFPALVAAILTWWRRFRDPLRAATVHTAVAVIVRELHRLAPDGPAPDTRVEIELPAALDPAAVERALRRLLDREPDFYAVPLAVRATGAGDQVAVALTLVPVEPFLVKVVFDDATEVRLERICSERRRLRIGRGEQREDGTLNHVPFESTPSLRWIPRCLVDIEWSASAGHLMLDVPVESADSVAVLLVRAGDPVVAEAGTAHELRPGDVIVIRQVNGTGAIALRIFSDKKGE